MNSMAVILGDPSKPDETKLNGVFAPEDLEEIAQLKDALAATTIGREVVYLDNHDSLLGDLAALAVHGDTYCLNLCDNGYQNNPAHEANVAAYLEMLDLPYSGSPPFALAACYDKLLVRGLARQLSLPIPGAIYLRREDDTRNLDIPFGYPVLVKPNCADGSFGITAKSLCRDKGELDNAMHEIRDGFGYKEPVLIEEFLPGREFTVGIVGNSPGFYEVLPIIGPDYSVLPDGSPEVLGQEAKWDHDSPYWQIEPKPVDLQDDVREMVVRCSLAMMTRLQARDYFRVDWRCNRDGEPCFLECNPNPAWCFDGDMAKMAGFGGHTYADFLRSIYQAVEERIGSAAKGGE